MKDLFIINKFNNEVFTSCDECDVEMNIVKAKDAYASYLIQCKTNKTDYPHNAEYWDKDIQTYQKILDAGFEAVTFEEYLKREKERFLNKEPKEVTEDEYNDALNCLPPLGWTINEKCSMFFISEPEHLSFHAQYIYVKATGKYYTAIADVLDRNTWIDKLLNI